MQVVDKEKEPRVVVIIDGVRFEIDDSEADAEIRKDISRVIKGLFKILEKRAQPRARH